MPPPERRDGDTPRSYAALIAYCDLGPTRSLEKLVHYWTSNGLEKPPTKWLSTLKRWSTDGAWVARANAYDLAIAASDEAARSAIRAARRAELEESDWRDGESLRQACAAMLMEMPRFLRHTENEIRQNGELVKVITLALKAGPGELARALKLASELQRLSVGEPTEHIQHAHEWVFDPTETTDPPPADAAATRLLDE